MLRGHRRIGLFLRRSLGLVFIGESDTSRLVGFHFQQAANGASAWYGGTVEGAFAVLVPQAVGTFTAGVPLHDSADPLVGVVGWVEEKSGHGFNRLMLLNS